MQPKDFILKIINLYQDARISRYSDEKIRRGRSHPISSMTEDLLASYLIHNDSSIEYIFIDQPVHIPGLVKSFCPDIVIVRKGVITAFLDLKMDLGWKRRGLIDLCKKDYDRLSIINGQNCYVNDGETKIRKSFPISKSIIYDIVIVSDQNISKNILIEQLEGAKEYQKYVAVHVLTAKEHPNTYGHKPEELLAKIQINTAEFQNLLQRIK